MTDPSHRGLSLAVWTTCALAVAGGLFCVGASLADWDPFLEDRRARLVVALLGRAGARAFYVVLGLGFVAAAVWWWLAWVRGRLPVRG